MRIDSKNAHKKHMRSKNAQTTIETHLLNKFHYAHQESLVTLRDVTG